MTSSLTPLLHSLFLHHHHVFLSILIKVYSRSSVAFHHYSRKDSTYYYCQMQDVLSNKSGLVIMTYEKMTLISKCMVSWISQGVKVKHYLMFEENSQWQTLHLSDLCDWAI